MEENAAEGRVPWRQMALEVFNLAPSNAVNHRLRRAHKEFVEHGQTGVHTSAGAGACNREARRRDGDEVSTLSVCQQASAAIGFELLQWFVDEIEAIRSRADSRLMLDQARWLREELVRSGTPLERLPKINKGWLFRWRCQNGISLRKGTTHFQVSWAKAVDRIRCMLGNVFRLRRLWELCHPGVAMRWLSVDQKPSWMNNAGRRPMLARKGARTVASKENAAATRDR